MVAGDPVSLRAWTGIPFTISSANTVGPNFGSGPWPTAATLCMVAAVFRALG